MRPSVVRDRLHAAAIAFVLCSTSVSIVAAGQPEDGFAAASAPAPAEPAGRHRSETADALRSFADMIAEAARAQERLSAALPSEACIDAVAASAPSPASGGAPDTGDGGSAAGEACAPSQNTTAL